MLKHDCFVINLDRSPQRYERITSQLENQKIEFTRLSAVDGSELSNRNVDSLYQYAHADAYYKQLNKGEIGCYLSHINAWQRIVDNALDFAIVLEDDVNLMGDLSRIITLVKKLPDDWDYIKLAEHSRTRQVLHRQQFDSFQRVTYNKIPARACAQIISLSGAKKLLSQPEKILRPVDIDLQYWWEKDLRVFGLMPYPVEPSQQFASDIDYVAQRKIAKRKRWKRIKQLFEFYWLNRRFTQRRLAFLNATIKDSE